MAFGGSLGSEEEARMLMQRSGAARNPRADHIINSACAPIPRRSVRAEELIVGVCCPLLFSTVTISAASHAIGWVAVD